MITSVNSNISNLKNLWIELFMDKTNKVTNVADGSVLNATAYGTAKIAQKALKDIAIVESQIFPESATGDLLDKAAALFGTSPRKGALGSSTYVRVSATPGTVYGLTTYFIARNGTRFLVDRELTVDSSGYGYVSVKSTVTGSSTNVEANSINQVTPRPITHIECINEYQAIGGRDFEDDETFRVRIKNNDNKLSKGTVEYWTQIFQDLDSRVLRVINVGLGEDAKTHIYLVTQNGSFFTEEELSTLLKQASSYFGLTEIDLSGDSIGIVLENAEWMYVGGSLGVDFRVELASGIDNATARKNIQIALTKYLDFRFWIPGKIVRWDDLLQIVKNSTGVKYVPDEFFNPFYDETVPMNQLPRIKGFVMRNLNGEVLFDADSVLSNIFYPSGASDIYTNQQNQALSQTQTVQITVTSTRGAAVEGAVLSIGKKIIITNSEGQARLLLENGEYEYVLSKTGWNQQGGSFVVLNAGVNIVINNFSATLQTVTFEVLQESTPVSEATIAISNQTLNTDSEGQAQIEIEPGTYSYSITKIGLIQIIGAVIVDTQPVKVTEYMFPQIQAVSVSVIDRERDIFVPGADVWIQDLTKKTNTGGQTEFSLIAGTYSIIVQRQGYLLHEEEISVSRTEDNCILIELAAAPYQVSFTVLDMETSNPIEDATVSVNNRSGVTNGQGLCIISLPDGVYPFTVIRSGYEAFSGSIIVDGDVVGIVVKMNKAYWETKFVVRDIDTGFLLQGALTSINNNSALTDINGETSFKLSNGTYPYEVSLAEYRTVTAEKIVFDEDSSIPVFLTPRDRFITFNVKDKITKQALPASTVTIKDSGTGVAVSTIITNSQGAATAELPRGNYTFTVISDDYLDYVGEPFDVNLKDFSIEVLMDIRPIGVIVNLYSLTDSVNGENGGLPLLGEKTLEFTGKTYGEVFSITPLKVKNQFECIPDTYTVKISGNGVKNAETELLIGKESQVGVDKWYSVTGELIKEVQIMFNVRNPKLPATYRFNVALNLNIAVSNDGNFDVSWNRAAITTVFPSYTIFPGNRFYAYAPANYKFQVERTQPLGSEFLSKYYKILQSVGLSSSVFTVDDSTPATMDYFLTPMVNGVIVMSLYKKNTPDSFLPSGEKFDVTFHRIVAHDYPLEYTETVTSELQNGKIIASITEIPLGEYGITITPQNAKYLPTTITGFELSNDASSKNIDVFFEVQSVLLSITTREERSLNLLEATSQLLDYGGQCGEYRDTFWPALDPGLDLSEADYLNQYDPASMIPDGDWATPTEQQFQTLFASGYEVDSSRKGVWFPQNSGGNSIFLPFVGIRDENGSWSNSYAGYWSCTNRDNVSETRASILFINATTYIPSIPNLGVSATRAHCIYPVKKADWINIGEEAGECIEVPVGSGIFWAKGPVVRNKNGYKIATYLDEPPLLFQWARKNTGYSSENIPFNKLSIKLLEKTSGLDIPYRTEYRETPTNFCLDPTPNTHQFSDNHLELTQNASKTFYVPLKLGTLYEFTVTNNGDETNLEWDQFALYSNNMTRYRVLPNGLWNSWQYVELPHFSSHLFPETEMEQLRGNRETFTDLLFTVNLNPLVTMDSINLSNAYNLKNLELSGYHLPAINLSKNKNLETLDLSKNKLSILDLSNNMYLKQVTLLNNNLEQLNLYYECKNLMQLNVSTNKLSTLDLGLNKYIKNLNISSNKFESFSIQPDALLEIFNCQANPLLSSLNFPPLPYLKNLYCTESALTEIQLTLCPNLEALACGNTSVSSLDFSNSTQLRDLVCSNNPGIGVLELSKTKVSSVYCNSCNISTIVLPNTIRDIAGVGNKLTSLDFLEGKLLLISVNLGRNLISGIFSGFPNPNSPRPMGQILFEDNELTEVRLNATAREMRHLNISSNPITTLSLESVVQGDISALNCLDLASVSIIGTSQINVLNIRNAPELTEVVLGQFGYDSTIETLQIIGAPLLFSLNPSNAIKLHSVNIQDCEVIKVIEVSFNEVESFSLLNLPALTDLDCSNNNLALLNVNNLHALATLNCSNSSLTTLDVSQNTALIYLYCYDNPFISGDTSLVNFANSLPQRLVERPGILALYNPSQAAKIKSITDAKNWTVS